VLAVDARLSPHRAAGSRTEPAPVASDPSSGERRAPDGTRLVLAGIAVSGFCALGYEVLWTRMLTMVLGTSTYAFTLLLVAFLCGIGAGGAAYGFVERAFGFRGFRGLRDLRADASRKRAMAAFGVIQMLIGGAALAVTYTLKDLPARSVSWLTTLRRILPDEFAARLGAGLVAALVSMFLPAFLMGIAFPLAARIRAPRRSDAGRALGEVAAWDTAGAIAGAAGSGLVLVSLFGVERSLQMLCVLNLGLGLLLARGR